MLPLHGSRPLCTQEPSDPWCCQLGVRQEWPCSPGRSTKGWSNSTRQLPAPQRSPGVPYLGLHRPLATAHDGFLRGQGQHVAALDGDVLLHRGLRRAHRRHRRLLRHLPGLLLDYHLGRAANSHKDSKHPGCLRILIFMFFRSCTCIST